MIGRPGTCIRFSKEVWRTYLPKHGGNNNEDEDNSLKTVNDKNHQASSQKFRQLIKFSFFCGSGIQKF